MTYPLTENYESNFAGSTSGGLLTKENLRLVGGTPRVQAGLYFRNHPDVDFFLPTIVQCARDGVIEELRALGFGDEHPVPWRDQFLRNYCLN